MTDSITNTIITGERAILVVQSLFFCVLFLRKCFDHSNPKQTYLRLLLSIHSVLIILCCISGAIATHLSWIKYLTVDIILDLILFPITVLILLDITGTSALSSATILRHLLPATLLFCIGFICCNQRILSIFVIVICIYGLSTIVICYRHVMQYENQHRHRISTLEGCLRSRILICLDAATVITVAWSFFYPSNNSITDVTFYITEILAWMVFYTNINRIITDREEEAKRILTLQIRKKAEKLALNKKNFMNNMQKYCIDTKLYLQPNLRESELAAAIGSNRTTFKNLLKECTGLTFYDYIYMLRVRYAAELLITSNNPINEIVIASGCTLTAFYYHFAKNYGISPKEYRTLHQDKL